MKIKYKTATGEVICMGPMPGLTAGQGETVSAVSVDIPSETLENYSFNGTTLIRKQQADIDADLIQKIDARKNRKRALLTKLGLVKQDIKALVDLIQDGHDD